MKDIYEVRERLQLLLDEYGALQAELAKLESRHYRVCIFGSARIRPEDPTYQRVRELARQLAEQNIDIVTGGGPGLMEAANLGEREARNRRSMSFGLPIELPNKLEPPNLHLDIKSSHKRFSSRLDEFMRLTNAVIVAPGGIGTLLELVFAWQLVQVHMIESRPIILLGSDIWGGLIHWMRESLLARGFVSPQDFDCIRFAETAEDVLEILTPHQQAFLARRRERPAAPDQSLERLVDAAGTTAVGVAAAARDLASATAEAGAATQRSHEAKEIAETAHRLATQIGAAEVSDRPTPPG
jgi:uncharacterized protein (TIGR00730 family)